MSLCESKKIFMGGKRAYRLIGISSVSGHNWPVAIADAVHVTPSADAPELKGRILVVDDEARIRKALRRLLRAHEVLEAGSSEQAQQILTDDMAFDCILCDVMLPGVSGLELHQWLAETNPSLARRVVFITAGVFGPQMKQRLDAVENPKVMKPFDVEQLSEIVRGLIGSSPRLRKYNQLRATSRPSGDRQ